MQRIGKYCNCKNPECTSPGNNYECCSENVPNGGTPRYGLWVESNYCDKTKGLPVGAENNESYTAPIHRNTGNIENYKRSNSYEEEQEEEQQESDSDNEDDPCSNWKSAFYAIFILLIVAMILSTVIYLKSNHRV